MGYRCFEVDVTDKVGHLVLNRPDELNTLLPEFWRELPEAVGRLSDSGEARALVISSTGKHFTAGLDLASVGGGSGLLPEGELGRGNAVRQPFFSRIQAAVSILEQVRMPVLAAVQGGCIGGGLDLITTCDMRYATEDAFFVVQETNIGITADLGTLQRLPKIIPDGVARELVYTGRRMPASRARDVGLLNEIFPDQPTMLDAVLATAAEIAAHSPLVVWGSKQMLVHARDHAVAEGLVHVATWQAGAMQRADVEEAMRARAERRAPVFGDLPPVPPL